MKLKRELLDRIKERLTEEEFYQQALSKYEVSGKSNLTKKELTEKGKQLERKIIGAKEKLDQLVTQDVLMKNFSNIRKETKLEKWVATLGESYLFPLWISSLVSPIPSFVPISSGRISISLLELWLSFLLPSIPLAITQNRLAQLEHQESFSHLENMQRTNVLSYDREETLSLDEHMSKQLLMDTFHQLAGISYEDFRQLDLIE